MLAISYRRRRASVSSMLGRRTVVCVLWWIASETKSACSRASPNRRIAPRPKRPPQARVGRLCQAALRGARTGSGLAV